MKIQSAIWLLSLGLLGCGPVCGDGKADDGEECDDGNLLDADGCNADCSNPVCGDGIVDALVEECDDGNLIDGDGCNADCTSSFCGDNIVGIGEVCDDGNNNAGDDCRADCLGVELCGDSQLDSVNGEICDDGNITDGDGCDSDCTLTGCGNGIVAGNEECDDENNINGDGCDNNCTNTACGNGVVALDEECDDGDLIDNDGCDSNCTTTACGNGVIAGAELCDDSNVLADDGCRADCLGVELCGDGLLDSATGEICDDGDLIDNDGCDSNCTNTGCGNGITNTGEACDDGNPVNGDGCDTDCTISVGCGNGIVNPGEVCYIASAPTILPTLNIMGQDRCRTEDFFQVGDVTGDGLDDIIFPTFDQANSQIDLSININQGNNNFSQSLINLSLGDPTHVPGGTSVSDLDGDQDLDITISSLKENTTISLPIYIATNNGSGVFSIQEINIGNTLNDNLSCSLDTVNVSGDPLPEFILGDERISSTSNIAILNNAFGVISQTAQQNITINGELNILRLANVDSEPSLDLIITTKAINPHQIEIRNNVAGLFPSPVFIDMPIDFFNTEILFADLDGDQDTDIITGGEDFNIGGLFHTAISTNNNNTFTNQAIATSQFSANAAIDIDSDGDTDLTGLTFINGTNEIILSINDGSGNFSTPSPLIAGLQVQQFLGTGLFNNDLLPDFVVRVGLDQIVLILSNP